MKIYQSLIFVLWAFCFGSTTANAQVLWYGNPNKAVREVFRRLDPDGNKNPRPGRCVDNPRKPPQVSNPTDSRHGKIWRIYKPSQRKRAEFARTNGFDPKEGGTYYIGWRWKITSRQRINNGLAVFQWKTDDGGSISRNKQNYPFNLGYDGTHLSLNAYGPGSPDWRQGASIDHRRTTLWRGAVSPGQWVSLVFKVKVSHNANQGYIEFWFNGNKQTLKNMGTKNYRARISSDGKRAYHKTNDGRLTYMKWGVYNENACQLDVTVEFDEMRVATTYSAAAPSGSNGGGGGGGGGGSDPLAGVYIFKNLANGLYLDSDGRSLKVGDNKSGADKRWALVPASSGYYNIDNQYEGRGVLETGDNKAVVNSTVAPKSTHHNKEWRAERIGNNTYRFKNRAGGRGYLAATVSGGQVEWTTWDGNRAQWVLEKVGNARMATLSNPDIAASNPLGVYPNPAQNQLMVANIPANSKGLVVYNSSGHAVMTQALGQGGASLALDIAHLPSGLYVMALTGQSEIVRQKFIKQ